MKKKLVSIIHVALCTSIVFLSAACNSEHPLADNKEQFEIGGEKSDISIIIKEESFSSGAKNKMMSRAIVESAETNAINLSDGLTAEVSLQEDDSDDVHNAPLSRAPLSDGKYFIYALDDATHVQVGSTMTGTVKDQVFTRDASSPRLTLPAGTYTFVCGTVNGFASSGSTQAFVMAGGNTMTGVLEHVAITGSDMQLAFTMKHHTARVRFKIVAYTPQIQGATVKLTSQYVQPGALIWTLGFTSINAFTNVDTQPKAVATTPSGADAKFVLANDFMTPYEYLLPETDGNDLKLNFIGGTAYGNVNLAGKTIDLKALGQMQRNKSYTVMVKLMPNGLYLFNDGTCGVLAEKGSRTPIGLVAKEKTSSEAGTAAALSQLDDGNTDYAWSTVGGTQQNLQMFPHTSYHASYRNAAANDDGYRNTWEPSYDGVTIKGDEQTKFPAFYAAGHYGDVLAANGIKVSGSLVGKKWFLPSVKEWIQLWKAEIPSVGIIGSNVYIGPLMAAAGGTYKSSWYIFLTSTESTPNHCLGFYSNYDAPIANIPFPQKTDATPVHPFVHF